jgi:predicted transposase YbfD/YdcC
VKANQPTLYEGIAFFFQSLETKLEGTRLRDSHGDRQELRQLRVSSELTDWAEWPRLAQVGELIHTWTRKGETHREVSYLITSLPREQAGPRRLLRLIRGHWGIENRIHWVRDVTFDEDRCQIRTKAAPQVMAALRNLVIGLLRLRKVSNIAAALRNLAGSPRRAIRLVTSPSSP